MHTKEKYYYITLVTLVICMILIATIFHLKGQFWIYSVGFLLILLYLKDVFTGIGWMERPAKPSVSFPGYTEDEYKKIVASYPLITKIEKQGYNDLIKLGVVVEKQQKLQNFVSRLKDYSEDEDYMTTLNYVMEYLDKKKTPFIMALDWKAPVEDLAWRINSSLKANFDLEIALPDPELYNEKSISFDHVFEDFDRPLRERSLQMGFIDTQSDEYVIMIHKVEDKQQVIDAVKNIGYGYFDKLK